MKKLNTIYGQPLTRAELRNFIGGINGEECATDCHCPPGHVVKPGGFRISLTCNGVCYALDYRSVTCTNPLSQIKCDDAAQISEHCIAVP